MIQTYIFQFYIIFMVFFKKSMGFRKRFDQRDLKYVLRFWRPIRERFKKIAWGISFFSIFCFDQNVYIMNSIIIKNNSSPSNPPGRVGDYPVVCCWSLYLYQGLMARSMLLIQFKKYFNSKIKNNTYIYTQLQF